MISEEITILAGEKTKFVLPVHGTVVETLESVVIDPPSDEVTKLFDIVPRLMGYDFDWKEGELVHREKPVWDALIDPNVDLDHVQNIYQAQRENALDEPVMPYCERVWSQQRDYDEDHLSEGGKQEDEEGASLDRDLVLFLEKLDD